MSEVPFTSACATCHDYGIIKGLAHVSDGLSGHVEADIIDCPDCSQKETAYGLASAAA